MSIKFHSSVIVCKNIKTMTKFYEDILDLKVEVNYGASVIFKNSFSLWQLSEKHVITKTLGYTYSPLGNNNFELCFETDDFDSALERLKAHKINYLHKTVVETWGQKTVRFYDPEKNLIELGESIPIFIKRMYSEGLSIEQLHEKTSVPVENIIEYLE